MRIAGGVDGRGATTLGRVMPMLDGRENDEVLRGALKLRLPPLMERAKPVAHSAVTRMKASSFFMSVFQDGRDVVRYEEAG